MHQVGYGSKFIHKIKVAHTNNESKIKINCLLSDHLTIILVYQRCLLSMLLYNIAAKVLANFINAHKRIKGIQTGNHVIKIINFAANTTILLRRDTTCLNRIQVILKLYENANINYLKNNFLKSQTFMG